MQAEAENPLRHCFMLAGYAEAQPCRPKADGGPRNSIQRIERTDQTFESRSAYVSRNNFFCTLPIVLRGKASTLMTAFGCLNLAS